MTQGEVEDTDITELAQFCKASHGLADKAKVEPLAASHLRLGGAASSPVSLISLTHHSGVNALAPDQTIHFGEKLTVVYGANAAGKSGYTRILKRACRARGAEEILGNVVSGTAPGRPAATIKYRLDGADHDYRWDDDNPADRDLSRVSVFDRHCASVYIAEQTDVAYRPLGLDLFDKLAEACESVRRVLETEKKALEAAATQLPEVGAGTTVHDLLSRLTSLTKPMTVLQLASLSDAESAQLEDLRKRLRDLNSDDPQKTARAIEIRAKRLEGLMLNVRNVVHVLAEATVAETFSARDRFRAACEAAETMRRETFETQPVPNTGSEAWRALWNAAARFSNEDVYPEESFPVTETNARCVLCQQQLREEAIARFRKFHQFLSSEVQRERDQALQAHEQRRTALLELIVTDDATNQILDELQLDNGDLAEAARTFLASAQHRRVAVLNSLADHSASPSGLPALAPMPEQLAQYIDNLRRRAGELRGADRSAIISEVERQFRELESRQILLKHLDAVFGEIDRKQRLAAYQLCLEETKTNAITRKSSELTKLAVTDQLAKSFKDELNTLGFRHVEVEMVAAGGARGVLYHKLQLRRAPGVSVPKVVSEGEARCLSIASFFAELSTAADRSAILFDDPVSSLDHHWRSSVAERLVKESQSRQVIVFTHDIVFLLSLVDHAEKSGVEPKHQYLRRVPNGAGLSEQRLPWAAMKVKDRIGHLKDLYQAAAKLHRDGKQPEYEKDGAHIYGLLREAWERGIEEILLEGVVERYRNSVQTLNKIHKLSTISIDDCRAVENGMDKCSKWLAGHDQAAAENEPFPDPSDLERDIRALEDWVKTIRDRRK